MLRKAKQTKRQLIDNSNKHKEMKVIKLKESDLHRIIKRVLNEQQAGDDIKKRKLPQEILNFIKKYKIKAKYNLVSVSGTLGVRFGVNQGKNHSDISVEDINTYEKNKNNLSKCTEKGEYQEELLGNEPVNNYYDEDWEDSIEKKVNQKYPNTEYCGVLQKVQRIIKGG